MALLGRWTGGSTSLIPTTAWTVPANLFPTQVRNDSSVYTFDSATSKLTLPSSGLADGYLLVGWYKTTDSSNGRYNPQGRIIQSAGTGNFIGGATGGYSRDNSENVAYVRCWAFVDSPSAAAQFQFQFKRDSDSPIGGTTASGFDVIPLYYADRGIYGSSSAALYGGTTPNKVTGFTGTSGTNITISGDTVTVTGDNKRYLCIGSYFFEGAGTRTLRWGGFREDGSKLDHAKAYSYYRDGSNDESGEIFSTLIKTATASKTIDLFVYRGDGVGAGQGGADVDGNTPTFGNHAMVILELHDNAEVFQGIDDAGGVQLATPGAKDQAIGNTTALEFNDAASFDRSSSQAINVNKDMDALFGANISAAQEVVGTTSRWTAAIHITKNGVEDAQTEAGDYMRNNQGSLDTFGWSGNTISFMTLSSGDDVGTSVTELSSTEGGGTVEVQPNWGGMWGINLDTLEPPLTVPISKDYDTEILITKTFPVSKDYDTEILVAKTATTPVLESFTSASVPINTSILSLTKPSGVQVGDLLFVYVDQSNVGHFSNWPQITGWNMVGYQYPSDYMCSAIYWRFADGTEGATLDITQLNSTNHQAAGFYMRLSNVSKSKPFTAPLEAGRDEYGNTDRNTNDVIELELRSYTDLTPETEYDNALSIGFNGNWGSNDVTTRGLNGWPSTIPTAQKVYESAITTSFITKDVPTKGLIGTTWFDYSVSLKSSNTLVVFYPEKVVEVDYDTDVNIVKGIAISKDYDTDIEITKDNSVQRDYDSEITITKEIPVSKDYDTVIAVTKPATGGSYPVLESFTMTDGSYHASPDTIATKPSGVVAGDLLLIFYSLDSSNSSETLSIVDGHGFNFLFKAGNANSDAHVGAFWKIADGTEAATEIVRAATNYDFGVFYLRVSNVDQTNPISAIGNAYGSGTTSYERYTFGLETNDDFELVFSLNTFDGSDATFTLQSDKGWPGTFDDADQLFKSSPISGNGLSTWWVTKEVADAGTNSQNQETATSISDGHAGFQFSIRPGVSSANPISWDYDTLIAVAKQIGVSTDYDSLVEIAKQLSLSKDYDTLVSIAKQLSQQKDYDTLVSITKSLSLSKNYDSLVQIAKALSVAHDYDSLIAITKALAVESDYDTLIAITKEIAVQHDYDTLLALTKTLSLSKDYDALVAITKTLSVSKDYDSLAFITKEIAVSKDYDSLVAITKTLSQQKDYDSLIYISKDIGLAKSYDLLVTITKTIALEKDYDSLVLIAKQFAQQKDYDSLIAITKGIAVDIDYDTHLLIAKHIPIFKDYDALLAVAKALSLQKDYNTLLAITKALALSKDYDALIDIAKGISVQKDYDAIVEILKQIPLTKDYDSLIALTKTLQTESNYDSLIRIAKQFAVEHDYDSLLAITKALGIETDYDTELGITKTVPTQSDYDTLLKVTIQNIKKYYDAVLTIAKVVNISKDYDTFLYLLTPDNIAIEMDEVIAKLIEQFTANLSWLEKSYGKAFRLRKIAGNRELYLPQVYDGKKDGVPSYVSPMPDSSTKSILFFVVGDEEYPNFFSSTANMLEWDIGIIFWVNLQKIDSDNLNADLFTQRLIRDARRVLTNMLLGQKFQIDIKSVTRDIEDVYKEFDLPKEKSQLYLYAPYNGFRFNCRVSLREEDMHCTPN